MNSVLDIPPSVYSSFFRHSGRHHNPREQSEVGLKLIDEGLPIQAFAITYYLELYCTAASPTPRNLRYLSTDPNKSIDVFHNILQHLSGTTTSFRKYTFIFFVVFLYQLLVLGGNGFVGSHVCKQALDQGLTVASLSRSGKPSINEQWVHNVTWRRGDLLSPDSLKEAFSDATAVISCVGGFGSNSFMYKLNGTANINAIRTAADQGVKRFVYISAADFGIVNYLLQGYYEGKRAAETELLNKYLYGGVILRPGFIHGTRRVGSLKVPLAVIGSPLEMVFQRVKPLSQIPLVGPLFTPPVSVNSVAKVAVRAATDPVFPPGIVDVHGILRYK
ncbi:uncharacterized protein At1g32220, chloroplastic-like [Impatiens glandulifera]|uniref:uncharacterized protein At1g32220, chloroplastic-like n=1 Tax=Impatiens glandulifera TaxID=253017 RepID=UPI001FB1A21E|nr:uncharacterized protein At1g32220, chloroplastic-like [Impatiens glandulifera]